MKPGICGFDGLKIEGYDGLQERELYLFLLPVKHHLLVHKRGSVIPQRCDRTGYSHCRPAVTRHQAKPFKGSSTAGPEDDTERDMNRSEDC